MILKKKHIAGKTIQKDKNAKSAYNQTLNGP
jgi:hypothetical protein